MQVQDRTFLITGAASGLGAATAERLVKAGGKVVLCDMSDRVTDLAVQLGAHAQACIADITSADAMQEAVNKAVALGGRKRSFGGWFIVRVWSAWPSWWIGKATQQISRAMRARFRSIW